MKKTTWVFVFPKYGKFWSISLGQIIKHKPLISEEWYTTNNSEGNEENPSSISVWFISQIDFGFTRKYPIFGYTWKPEFSGARDPTLIRT